MYLALTIHEIKQVQVICKSVHLFDFKLDALSVRCESSQSKFIDTDCELEAWSTVQ